MNQGLYSPASGNVQGPTSVRTYALLSAAILLLSMPLANAAPRFVDVTSQVAVTRSGLVFNRVTNTFDSFIKIPNTSSRVVGPPLVLVITNLTQTTVTVANQ